MLNWWNGEYWKSVECKRLFLVWWIKPYKTKRFYWWLVFIFFCFFKWGKLKKSFSVNHCKQILRDKQFSKVLSIYFENNNIPSSHIIACATVGACSVTDCQTYQVSYIKEENIYSICNSLLVRCQYLVVKRLKRAAVFKLYFHNFCC